MHYSRSRYFFSDLQLKLCLQIQSVVVTIFCIVINWNEDKIVKCFFFLFIQLYLNVYFFFYFQLARTNRNIAVWWKWWNFVNLKIFAGTVVCLVKSHNALKTECITFPSYLRINTVSRVIVYCIIFWSDKCAFIIMRRIHILLQFTTICILDKCSRY